jgi:hypothetical protein
VEMLTEFVDRLPGENRLLPFALFLSQICEFPEQQRRSPNPGHSRVRKVQKFQCFRGQL